MNAFDEHVRRRAARDAAPVVERAFVIHEAWAGDEHAGIPWPHEIEITRRTAKTVFVKSCQATGFGRTLRPEQVFPTFDAARTVALQRIGTEIEHLTRKADKLREGMSALFTAESPPPGNPNE